MRLIRNYISRRGADVAVPGAPRDRLMHRPKHPWHHLLRVSNPDGQKPVIKSRTVVANGVERCAVRGAFLIGPTGLVVDANNALDVSDMLADSIVCRNGQVAEIAPIAGKRESTPSKRNRRRGMVTCSAVASGLMAQGFYHMQGQMNAIMEAM